MIPDTLMNYLWFLSERRKDKTVPLSRVLSETTNMAPKMARAIQTFYEREEAAELRAQKKLEKKLEKLETEGGQVYASSQTESSAEMWSRI